MHGIHGHPYGARSKPQCSAGSGLQLEDASFLCWLLKDAGWVLLCPQISLPAAMGAILLESHDMKLRWHCERPAEQVHSLAALIWLLGNAVWMASELCLLPSPEEGRHFPWYQAAILRDDAASYNAGQAVAQLFFGCGISMLIVFYLCSWRWMRQWPQSGGDLEGLRRPIAHDDEPAALIWGIVTAEVYTSVFIGPWILTDIFWSLDLTWLSLLSAVIAMCFVGDCLRRFGGPLFFAELLWLIANAIWIFSEEALGDAFRSPRIAGAAMLGAAFVIVLLMPNKSRMATSQRPLCNSAKI
mmetsp:Transcript_23625/g.52376  ORF Transcript_23625/g.52376 Transcript_23625/m.52376 type:complete len:299 (+) Transcript_23625:169-1065(+)